MICHAWYPAIDAERVPASLSAATITQILRREHGFAGLIMTDDLDMGAILNEYGLAETIRRALGAGNDLAMICHRLETVAEAYEVLQTLDRAVLDRALENVAAFKRKLVPPTEFSLAAHAKLDEEVRQLRIDVLGAGEADTRSPEDGKRSPVEVY
jgi:beta-N-acetylhexosaminidase